MKPFLLAIPFAAALLAPPPLLAYDPLPPPTIVDSPQSGRSTAAERMKSCNPRIALAAAKEVLRDPKTLKEPAEMFVPAYTIYQYGEKDEGIFWLYAAQLRTRYQGVFQNGDRGQIMAVMMMTIAPPMNNYALHDTRKLARTLDKVLEWDRRTPNPYRDRPHTREDEAKLKKVYDGFGDFRTTLITRRESLERDARNAEPQMRQMEANMKSRGCRSAR